MIMRNTGQVVLVWGLATSSIEVKTMQQSQGEADSS